tara:strand:+ start:861 stop:1202 length:342 start_codon:yes stop_codon:yes gene_type:complete
MKISHTPFVSAEHEKSLKQFLHYAKNVLPSIAATKKNSWPIHNDHCFMRVILDNVCGCAWYDVIRSPAYQNLSEEKAIAAAQLAECIACESVSLHTLNERSKQWRKKQYRLDF